MSSMNRVTLVGRLGADPELHSTTTGTPVSNFRIATNESWKDPQGQTVTRTEWHRIVAWGRLAEVVSKHLATGSQVLIEGRLQTRKWEDKDGNTRYNTEIIAQNVRFLDRKQDKPTEAATPEVDGLDQAAEEFVASLG